MLCLRCWPPQSYKLIKSGWTDPEYMCPVCKSFFNDKGEEQRPPEIKETLKGLILDPEEEEELQEWFYSGAW